MELSEALDAVAADVRDHRITPDFYGLFTAIRHVDLLCHLVARTAADSEYRLLPANPDAPARPSAEVLGLMAGHLGRAVAHYTQALAPLVSFTRPTPASLQGQLDTIDLHRRLHVHLDDAGQALEAARACLDGPRRPPTPSTAAPVPRRTATVRRSA
ncbi:hypothetical protein OH768_47670 [Streptomyces sp. NBC_01622]|uniref:hypothetical protein n=1 Tax=Streptomyces sp. NBC_01622 TaxID=2975903 RepID=UPI0038694066|nr:hypothetical protein OH768_47670 [Streptomyces sp. NBC_01622]